MEFVPPGCAGPRLKPAGVGRPAGAQHGRAHRVPASDAPAGGAGIEPAPAPLPHHSGQEHFFYFYIV